MIVPFLETCDKHWPQETADILQVNTIVIDRMKEFVLWMWPNRPALWLRLITALVCIEWFGASSRRKVTIRLFTVQCSPQTVEACCSCSPFSQRLWQHSPTLCPWLIYTVLDCNFRPPNTWALFILQPTRHSGPRKKKKTNPPQMRF